MQLPWRDRRGRFLPFKAIVLALVCVPGLVVAGQWIAKDLGPMPITAAILETGLWTVRFFLMSLTVSPFRTVLNWPQLLLVRRMLGVTALVYGLIHLSLYVVDQKFALFMVVSEILSRFYLTIGFVALLGLSSLGATSTDAAIRRMGRWWKRLHRAGYLIGVLAMLHFFLQSKANVSEATYAAGLLLWLLIFRVTPEGWQRRVVALVGLAVVATLATVATEYAWYALSTKIPASRVAAANLEIDFGLRPAHWVFVTALAVPVLVVGWGIAERWRPMRGAAPAPTSARRSAVSPPA